MQIGISLIGVLAGAFGGATLAEPLAGVLAGVPRLSPSIPWKLLPKEMGCGSGSTCWRRLRDWQEAGVWRGLHRALLDRLEEANEIDWSRACRDSASVPDKGGREGR